MTHTDVHRYFAMLVPTALVLVSATAVCVANPTNLAYVEAPVSAQQLAGDIHHTILSPRYLEGMHIVLAGTEDANDHQVIAETFFCATDPDWSPDGKRLIFAGKRSADDPLQLWEVSVDSLEPKQLFACDHDCIRPRYLPNGHVLFASLLSGEYEEHGGTYSLSLYEWVSGSKTPTRLSFNPSSDFDPAILPDGRVVFSSWQHVGNHAWPRGNIALNLTNWDGTGIFPVTGNHRGPWLKRGATALSEERIAFVQAESLAAFGAGDLMATTLNDAFAPYQPLIAPDTYRISDAAPLPDGNILVSARPTQDQEQPFALYVLEDGNLKPLGRNTGHHALNPAVYLPDRPVDTRFSTVLPGTPFGYVLILNCFETDRPDAPPLSTETVRTVRVIEGMPLKHNGEPEPEFVAVPGRENEPLVGSYSATGYIPSRILGEVPPATDGSVYLKVPADRPLRLQLIDQDGFRVVNERAWFWVRPNERRVCIGCHENREISPHNASPKAAGRAATDLTDPSQWKTVTFREDIQPIVRKNCAVPECHIPPRPTAGMNLKPDQLNRKKDEVLADRFGPPYANLLKRQEGKPMAIGGRRVHPGDSRESPMLWMLYGRVLGTQYYQAPFDTPINSNGHPGPMLPEEQLSLIRQWIDLGAVYESQARTAPWPAEKYAVWKRTKRHGR